MIRRGAKAKVLSLPTGSVGVVLSSVLAFFSSLVWSQAEIDPEWPCIQRLVMEVSPAVLWPVPVEEIWESQWRSDEQIRLLAERLGDMNTYSDDARASVQAFAESLAPQEAERRLSLLALGTLAITNDIRRQYIAGIKRYTRQQIAIADQIEQTLNELSLQSSEDASGSADRESLRSTLHWHERVYDQREQAIRLLCEQPVELEQTLSDVLRDMAQYLP